MFYWNLIKLTSFLNFFLTIEQIDPRPLKITLIEPDQSPLPFLIIKDPFVFIETKVLWDKSTKYAFELYRFYRNINLLLNIVTNISFTFSLTNLVLYKTLFRMLQCVSTILRCSHKPRAIYSCLNFRTIPSRIFRHLRFKCQISYTS